MSIETSKTLYRLWIGNLDPKLTEYSLLKILQKVPITIEKFDFVYHKTGVDKGKSRGYCFVTVSNIPDVEKIIQFMDGRLLMGRRMTVKPADGELMKKQKKNKFTVPSSLKSHSDKKDTSKQDTSWRIRQIEKKLKSMEKEEDSRSFFS